MNRWAATSEVDRDRRRRVFRRYGVRLGTGLACMAAFIPLTLWIIPVGALAWFLGQASLRLAVRGLMDDDAAMGPPPMGLRERERTQLEFLTTALTILIGIGTIIGLVRLAAASPWATEASCRRFAG